MKKWNRALALLLAAGLMLGLTACGGSADSPSPAPASQAVSQAVSPAPTLEPEPTQEPTPEPTPTPEPELHGLVIADYSPSAVTVYCFNLDTSESTILSSFSLPPDTDNESYQFSGGPNSFGCFSSDYSKRNAVKRIRSSGETHAGWIDTNGNFFDVTEALGLQSKSDFDDPVYYFPNGFCDGYFSYYQIKKIGSLDYTYSYVPLDNVSSSAIQAGNVFLLNRPFNEKGTLLMDGYWSIYPPSSITCWIDDTHCIVNDYSSSDVDSFIVDTDAQIASKYIPGDSRDNWFGRISPDGTKIAFMSKPRNVSLPETDIYIIPIEGGDPVKVTGHSFDLTDLSNLLNIGCTLIGWI